MNRLDLNSSLLKPDEDINLLTPLERVRIDGYQLQFIPEELQTNEMYLEAVKQSGEALRYVPVNKQTHEICLEAVKKHPFAITSVKNRTEDLCLQAVKKLGWSIQILTDDERTELVCLEAVKVHGMSLQFVKNKNEKICLEAVKSCGYSLQFIPDNDQTLEICLEAVKKNGLALSYVKNTELRTTPEKLYLIEMEAVKEDGDALQYISKERQTAEIIDEAIKSKLKSIKHIKDISIKMKFIKLLEKDTHEKISKKITKSEVENKQNIKECMVCLDKPDEIIKLSCDHYFCFESLIYPHIFKTDDTENQCFYCDKLFEFEDCTRILFK